MIYYNDPEKSAEAHIAPGVFTLGEIAYMNEDGYVLLRIDLVTWLFQAV